MARVTWNDIGSALAVALAATAWSCGGSPTAPSASVRSIVVNGTIRTYTLHMPGGFRPGVGALVIALHGGGGTGASFENLTGLSKNADQSGFAVAYPDGLFNPRLNASDWQYFGNDFTDDVAFVRQLINALIPSVQPDPRRIYVTGFSDGGRLAHRAAVELSDQIAAIGDVGGSLFQGISDEGLVPAARAPVSVIILHGDADAYCGAPLDASQDQTFNYWAGAADHCASVDTPLPLCDSQGFPTAVVDKDASSCSSGTEVKFYRLVGGRHNWYTTPLNFAGQLPFNPDLNMATGTTTNDIIWNFFAVHPKS